MDFSSQLANFQRTAANAARAPQQHQQDERFQQRGRWPEDGRERDHSRSRSPPRGRRLDYSRSPRGHCPPRSYDRRQRQPHGRGAPNYGRSSHQNSPPHQRRPSQWQEMRRILSSVPPYRPKLKEESPKEEPSQKEEENSPHKEDENTQQQQEEEEEEAESVPQKEEENAPQKEDESTQTSRPFHLCLLAITIDDLPFQDIWKEWASMGNGVGGVETRGDNNESGFIVSLIGHSKHPDRVQSDWFRNRLLVKPPRIGRGREYAPPMYHTRRPEWGSVEITRAMLDLAAESLRIGTKEERDVRFSTDRYGFCNDIPSGNTSSASFTRLPPVDKVLFISETCLPVVSKEEFYRATEGKSLEEGLRTFYSSSSWVNARNTPNNGYSRQSQFDRINSVIPRECCWKADQWMLLSRDHVEAIFNLDQSLPLPLWRCFTDTRASDELLFPTALGLLGLLQSPSPTDKNVPNQNGEEATYDATREVSPNRRVTYADWTMSARNPASFRLADLERVAKLAREEGCLVARKFADSLVTVEEWKKVLPESDSDGDFNDF